MDKEDINNTLFLEKLTAPPEISGVPFLIRNDKT